MAFKSLISYIYGIHEAVKLMGGNPTETAPATDTASSGLNGRAQRIAQRITSLLTLTGDVVEAAPASDTASSGLNGRSQRIAQNITTMIGIVTTSRDHLSTIKDTLSGTVANTYNNIIVAKTGAETTTDIQLTKTAYAITALGLAAAETVVLEVKDPVSNTYFAYITLTAAAPVESIVNLPVTARIVKSATIASVGVVLSYH